MKKIEVVNTLAIELNVTKVRAKHILDTVLEVISEGVVKDGEVSFMGFGKFEVTERKVREGRNPQTGAPMIIPSSKSVKFKVGKELKDAVNR